MGTEKCGKEGPIARTKKRYILYKASEVTGVYRHGVQMNVNLWLKIEMKYEEIMKWNSNEKIRKMFKEIENI